jgi:sugar lactone lactonase YvrE
MSLLHRFPRRTTAAALVLLAAACAKKDEAPVDTPPARDPNTPVFTVSTGLSTPESVLWDATRGVWYISNINGNAPEKDNNGYIVRVGANGEAKDSVPFIAGGAGDITLHAPKGMALQGDTLWVADIDALRGFDVNTGKAVASVSLEKLGATFLNDVALGPDGLVYITDSGISFDAKGNVTHPGKSRLFAVNGRAPVEAVVFPKESAANGISWSPSRAAWVMVGFNTPTVFEWKPDAKEATSIGTGPGGGDGLLVLEDGRVVYSSWADSSLNVFADGKTTTLRKGLPQPADLGFDPARALVAVPLFGANRVEFWPIETPASKTP